MFLYATFSSQSDDLHHAINEILYRITQEHANILRIVFFSHVDNNQDYLQLHKVIETCLKEHFTNISPLLSLVAQPPKSSILAAEITYLKNIGEKEIQYHTNKNLQYITITANNVKFLLTQGIRGNIDDNVPQQSDHIFSAIRQILIQENIPLCNIVRQWNYIENITDNEGEHQRYQLFNNARSKFYASTQWIYGYPAATGIGTQSGGIMVELDAVVSKSDSKLEIISINNTLQIAAHDYSKNVLVGETTTTNTPKFERAKYVCCREHETIFISGTASIRGEKTVYHHDVKMQTQITIENIVHLLSKETFEQYGVKTDNKPKIGLLRVYVKNHKNFEIVQQTVEELLPNIAVLYVQSDVCRPELLVEIEAIANFVS